MPSLPLAQVQEAIAKENYKWQARDTKISALARDAKPGALFGLSIGQPEMRDLMREGVLEIRKVFRRGAGAPQDRLAQQWREFRHERQVSGNLRCVRVIRDLCVVGIPVVDPEQYSRH